MFKLFLSLSCSILMFGCSPALVTPEDISRSVRSVVDAEKAPPFSGVIIIENGDRRVVEKVQGYQKIPIDMDQQFVIGDLSKQITAAITLKLADQGKINLHSPIKNYLPELSSVPWAKKITPHHLLSHTSGLGDGKTPSVVASPGKQFIYSNAGYDLLGKIVSRVELKTFSEQVLKISKECGMKNTVARESGDLKFFKKIYPKFVEGWRENSNGKFIQTFVERDENQNPSLGIMSTPEDMLKWTRCLHGGELLSPSSYRSMITSMVKMPHRWGEMSYGYGLQVKKAYGSLELSHSGNVPGFKSTMVYYPDEKVNLLILENISLKNPNYATEFGVHDGVRNAIIENILNPPVQ